MEKKNDRVRKTRNKLSRQNPLEREENGISAAQFHGSQTDPDLGDGETISVESEVQAETMLSSMRQDFKTPSEDRT